MVSHRRFHPKDIGSLHSLFDVMDIRGLNDGDAISTWPDLSGNGRDVTNTSTARPVFKTGIINGFPVVRFDGTNDSLIRTSASDMPTSDTSVVSCQYLNRAASSFTFGQGQWITTWGTSTTNQYFGAFYYKQASMTYTFSQWGSALSTLVEPNQEWKVTTTDKTGSGTSQLCHVFVTAPPRTTNSNSSNLNVQVVNTNHYIGQDGSSGGYWTGDMIGVAIYSRILTSSERTLLTNYWGARVGITL